MNLIAGDESFPTSLLKFWTGPRSLVETGLTQFKLQHAIQMIARFKLLVPRGKIQDTYYLLHSNWMFSYEVYLCG